MDRKEFLKSCGFACLGAVGVSTLVQSCTAFKHINAPIVNNQLQVPLSVFLQQSKKEATQYKRYIVVRNEQLNYPLVVYRNSENDYTALLMRCSHQFNELNVNGELLSCPAHGSEFNAKGEVVQGPAEMKLRSFITTADTQNLYIHLA
jgi:Rieske Fe-S protein